jgi:DNA-directed RNA polymerase specialized sigma subunit
VRSRGDEIEAAFLEVLLHLEERQREACARYYSEHRTQREVAAMLGVDQATVCRDLEDVAHRLRSALGARGLLEAEPAGSPVWTDAVQRALARIL